MNSLSKTIRKILGIPEFNEKVQNFQKINNTLLLWNRNHYRDSRSQIIKDRIDKRPKLKCPYYSNNDISQLELVTQDGCDVES